MLNIVILINGINKISILFIETLRFLYENFSVPILIFLLVLLFYKELKILINNLTNLKVGLGNVDFSFEILKNNAINDIDKTTKELIMNSSEKLIYEGQRGGGLGTSYEDIDMDEIILSKIYFTNLLSKYDNYYIVDKLFEAYEIRSNNNFSSINEENMDIKEFFLKTHNEKLIELDSKIRDFFNLNKDLQKNNVLLTTSDVSKYRYLIFATISYGEMITKNSDTTNP